MTVKMVGELPEWYGDVEKAWFPKASTVEWSDAPSFEGYMSVWDAMKVYPETVVKDWEVLNVSDVENCTVHTPYYFQR